MPLAFYTKLLIKMSNLKSREIEGIENTPFVNNCQRFQIWFLTLCLYSFCFQE